MGVDPGSKNAGVAILQDDKLIHFARLDFKTNSTSQGFAKELNNFYNYTNQLVRLYKPDIIVVEHTSVNNNLNTTKVLSYFEAIVLAVAGANNTTVERIRTTSARKRVLGKGNIVKKEAIKIINEKYKKIFDDDVAEAILFALCGKSLLEEINGNS